MVSDGLSSAMLIGLKALKNTQIRPNPTSMYIIEGMPITAIKNRQVDLFISIYEEAFIDVAILKGEP